MATSGPGALPPGFEGLPVAGPSEKRTPAAGVEFEDLGWSELVAHAQATYPYEACGLLLGPARASEWDRFQIVDVRPAENKSIRDRRRWFSVDPADLVRSDRTGGSRSLIGFYHSHPDVTARPSAVDELHAWPGYAHVIAAVRSGVVGEVRAFELTPVGFRLREIPVHRPGGPIS